MMALPHVGFLAPVTPLQTSPELCASVGHAITKMKDFFHFAQSTHVEHFLVTVEASWKATLNLVSFVVINI